MTTTPVNSNQYVYRHIPSGMLASEESPSGWCFYNSGGYKPFISNTEDDSDMNAAVATALFQQTPGSVEKIPLSNLMNDS